MCVSSFEPITYGYVYGGDIARCSVDDYLEETPHLAMFRFNNPHACKACSNHPFSTHLLRTPVEIRG